MNDSDIETLLTLAEQGDDSAKQNLLNCHRDRLRRMVSLFLDARLSARVDPSDVVQEALTIAASKLQFYLDERPIAFYPWLRKIAWEQLVMIHRKHLHTQRRTVNREAPRPLSFSDGSVMQFADNFIGDQTSPSRRAIREEMQLRVRIALQNLSEADREFLLMRYVEQLQIDEIADVLKISISSAKGRSRRALQRLHAQLGDQSGGFANA